MISGERGSGGRSMEECRTIRTLRSQPPWISLRCIRTEWRRKSVEQEKMLRLCRRVPKGLCDTRKGTGIMIALVGQRCGRRGRGSAALSAGFLKCGLHGGQCLPQ